MKKTVLLTLTFFAVAVLSMFVVSVYLIASKFIETGMSRFVLVNDSDTPITYTILHDDGDDSRNKSLTRPVSIKAYGESEVSEYGGTYCVYLLEGEQVIQALALEHGITRPHSMRADKSVYAISKLTRPCAFAFNFPFDER